MTGKSKAISNVPIHLSIYSPHGKTWVFVDVYLLFKFIAFFWQNVFMLLHYIARTPKDFYVLIRYLVFVILFLPFELA